MFIIQCPILWYAKVCALPSTHSSCLCARGCHDCRLVAHCRRPPCDELNACLSTRWLLRDDPACLSLLSSSKGGIISRKLNMSNNTLAPGPMPDCGCICVRVCVCVCVYRFVCLQWVRDQLPGVLPACPTPTIVTPPTTWKAIIQEIHSCGWQPVSSQLLSLCVCVCVCVLFVCFLIKGEENNLGNCLPCPFECFFL